MKKLLLTICLLLSLSGFSGNFEIGKGTFLLNGQPFLIKAAELHYSRIPREYWAHRIAMCKAMGMNSICIYIFWNKHEQQKDQFNFKDMNDIRAFCEEAQKQGMYIIVRPGPYVCAEWEMGGLPWWLLNKKDIALRSNDPYFIERTEKYIKKVGEQLADMQITRGGNIIMVQVENEFGSYGTDKKYVSEIRDIVRRAGFTDVPLFQCDWSSNFKNNALDDLVWTINFGTGANIDQQFRELSRIRPETPLMCSEFWSGWFDHWGRKHETRSPDALVAGMAEMVNKNISFSLYMAHGGTTFGHWGGANSPSYSAMCSSYDYDAPINESGGTTPKFFLLRDLLGKGEKLPDIPKNYPIITIPQFELSQVAPLMANLPKPVATHDVKPMEEFGQGWGSILYRTQIEPIEAGTRLVITDMHDWAQVYLDGEKIATLDRRRGENSVVVPAGKGGQLDILVEALGRVNFGVAIHDRKGITEKVELISEKTSKELKDWKVYSFPTDYKFSKNKKFKKDVPLKGAAYYRGTFSLSETGDTFLDMRGWGKGLVWVNGHDMGRFWQIGPQQTMYIPGCWLKKGENEIIILDMIGPEKAIISALDKPILDQLGGEASVTHRKRGETLSLESETAVAQGAFTPGNGWQIVEFTPTTTRYFTLEALSSQSGEDVAAIAEFQIIGEDGNNISRQQWKIVYADSEETAAGNCTADKIFDLQESTFWSTVYKGRNLPKYPHQIVIDLGKEYKVSGFRYLPRAEASAPGMIKEYRAFCSLKGFKVCN